MLGLNPDKHPRSAASAHETECPRTSGGNTTSSSSAERDLGVLQKAHDIVYGRAELEYGSPVDSNARIAGMWTALFGCHFDAHDVALAMICVKLSREMHSHKFDNLVDIAGYAELAQRIIDEQPKL